MSPYVLCDLSLGQRAWFEVMDTIRGKSVLDVGANEGGYTSDFLAHGAARVVAIEPGPVHAARLRQRFGTDERVVVQQCGLSDRGATLTGVKFHNCWTLARPGQFSNRLGAVSPGASAIEGEAAFDVELTTLDAVVSACDLRDLALCKIDTDGYEPHVLRGGARTLTTQRPAMLVELSYLPAELGESIDRFLGDIYDHLGYTVVTLSGQRASKAQALAHFPWDTSLDVMLLPAERAERFAPLA